jgi:hypothetical protein
MHAQEQPALVHAVGCTSLWEARKAHKLKGYFPNKEPKPLQKCARGKKPAKEAAMLKASLAKA